MQCTTGSTALGSGVEFTLEFGLGLVSLHVPQKMGFTAATEDLIYEYVYLISARRGRTDCHSNINVSMECPWLSVECS